MSLTRNQKTAAKMVGVVILMGSLSWASVPFYDWFCRVTGFGGTTSVAGEASDRVLDQTVLVRFDASKERGMPWDFKPMQHEMEIKLGETGLAFYEAYNPHRPPRCRHRELQRCSLCGRWLFHQNRLLLL